MDNKTRMGLVDVEKMVVGREKGREESHFLNVFQKPTLDNIRKRGTSVAKR